MMICSGTSTTPPTEEVPRSIRVGTSGRPGSLPPAALTAGRTHRNAILPDPHGVTVLMLIRLTPLAPTPQGHQSPPASRPTDGVTARNRGETSLPPPARPRRLAPAAGFQRSRADKHDGTLTAAPAGTAARRPARRHLPPDGQVALLG
jgi:hypothetical protein